MNRVPRRRFTASPRGVCSRLRAAEQALSRELEGRIKLQIAHLHDCRPKSLAMGDAIKWLKLRVSQLPAHLPPDAAKRILCSQIDTCRALLEGGAQGCVARPERGGVG